MLNEFDIRDWERVDFDTIKKVVEDGTYLNPWSYVNYFIEQVELLRDKQVQLSTKHVAAVEKAFKE